MPKCLITGCTLLDDNQERWVHGDLHLVGDCYVFNACMLKGETAWQYRPYNPEARCLHIVSGEYFERRGVVVLPVTGCELNAAAEAYLAGAP